MHLIRLSIVFSITSYVCWAQALPNQTTNSGPEGTQTTPVVTTSTVLLTPNGPVDGNPVAQTQAADNQTPANQIANQGTNNANPASAQTTRSSDYLVEGAGVGTTNKSLGDVAREYRARKGEQQEHANKTYDEDDLRALPGDRDQTVNTPPALTPDASTSANIGGNAALLPQSDEAAETQSNIQSQSQSNEKPSARGRSVVDEVNAELRQRRHQAHATQ